MLSCIIYAYKQFLERVFKMSYFLRNGNTFKVTTKDAMDLHEKLPAGNYVIKKDEMSGQLYLETIESFNISGKLYGDTTRHTGRILKTFELRGPSTVVMLSGDKGSGKTLLAKNIAFEAAKVGIPTIVINAPWCGDKFNSFIQMIEQPCVILFDEFEKVYDKEEQESILTLLDGVFPSKKLFILTCNDKWRVDAHMRNRPGRIFYMLDFKGLDEAFISEYCADNLEQKQHTDQICKIAQLFDQFNFDMLKALVEEMNRFQETPQESLSMLNAKPEFSGALKFKTLLTVNGVDLSKEEVADADWAGNPLSKECVQISYKEKDNKEDKDDWSWTCAYFGQKDLKTIDNGGTRYIFENGDGQKLTLTKVEEKYSDYWKAF